MVSLDPPSNSLSYRDTLVGIDDQKRPKNTIIGDLFNGVNTQCFGAKPYRKLGEDERCTNFVMQVPSWNV
jgi:hypothetical protein